MIFDGDAQSQGLLEAILRLADIGINWRELLFFMFGVALGVNEPLNEGFSLSDRE